MTDPVSPPETWGRGLKAATPERLRLRLSRCSSPEHLAAALAAERGRTVRDSRPERIDAIQTRLEEVLE